MDDQSALVMRVGLRRDSELIRVGIEQFKYIKYRVEGNGVRIVSPSPDRLYGYYYQCVLTYKDLPKFFFTEHDGSVVLANEHEIKTIINL